MSDDESDVVMSSEGESSDFDGAGSGSDEDDELGGLGLEGDDDDFEDEKPAKKPRAGGAAAGGAGAKAKKSPPGAKGAKGAKATAGGGAKGAKKAAATPAAKSTPTPPKKAPAAKPVHSSAGSVDESSQDSAVPTPTATPKAKPATSGATAAGAKSAGSKAAGGSASAGSKAAGGSSSAAPAMPAGVVLSGTPEEIILGYLKANNKPYSAINVFDNLHGVLKRPVVNKVLDQLADSGKIKSKCWSKFKLYWPDQDQYGEITEEVMAARREEARTTEEKRNEVKSAKRQLEARLAGLTNAMSEEELAAKLTALESEVTTLRGRLDAIQSNAAAVDPVARDKLTKKLLALRKYWSQRRSTAMEIIGSMAEGMEKKPAAVMELVGLESDAEAGANLAECNV